MVGSGVILVALNKGKVYYLFGKEGSMERDKNCHWGDFGGSAKTGEDLLDTTTREGAEELNGFFGSKHDFEKYILKNKVDEVAYDKRYTYLVRADYDEKLPFYFNNNYKFICEYLKTMALPCYLKILKIANLKQHPIYMERWLAANLFLEIL